MYNKIVIGIDQSYKNTGISIAADGKLKKIGHVFLENLKNNSIRREKLRQTLYRILQLNVNKAKEVIVIIERIRLRSQGFLNINYIKSIGALNATIVDVCDMFGVNVFSVDTRAWKSAIVGTSKEQNNKWGIDPKKWPTIKYIVSMGFGDAIKRDPGRKKIGVVADELGNRFLYDDDAADSACIALYGFCDKQLLMEER